MRWKLALAGLTTITLVVACDDDGDSAGGSPTVESGVPPAKTIDSLTDAEGAQLCDAYAAAASRVVTPAQACTLAGLLFAETPADCQQFAQLCRQNPDALGGGDDGGDDPEMDDCPFRAAADREKCTASIDEIETCFNATLANARTLVSGLSCSNAGGGESISDRLGAAFGGTDIESLEEVPSECATVQAKCPELFRNAEPAPGGPDAGPGGGDDDMGAPAADMGVPEPDAAPAADAGA
ncbi:MAG: hypothetical protein H6704_14280 [Myxococcales bacterium]|nr:hypothetical protein [Myxococcales bacterium]